MVAAILMILGISVFGMVTGAITTYFVRRRRTADPHVAQLISDLER